VNFLFAFIFLIASVWFFLSLLTQVMAGGSRQTPWQQLAERFNGRVSSSRWWGRSRIVFRYGESPVVVLRGRHRRVRHCVDVWLAWPESDWTLHIVAMHHPLPRAALRGLAPIQNHHDIFYRYFDVYTNDAARSQRILGETLRWEIQQLRQPPDIRDIEVRWHQGSLLVRKQVSPRDLLSLEQFIRRALRIYDQAMLMRAEGIEFVAVGEAQLIDRVNCQICGEEIVTDMVFCRQCQTPHHRECWVYFGRCAVFACQETEYFVPRIAPLRAPRGDAAGSGST
jgi:sarcosine oxidase delta subunit